MSQSCENSSPDSRAELLLSAAAFGDLSAVSSFLGGDRYAYIAAKVRRSMQLSMLYIFGLVRRKLKRWSVVAGIFPCKTPMISSGCKQRMRNALEVYTRYHSSFWTRSIRFKGLKWYVDSCRVLVGMEVCLQF
jgi:hypothetical protein